MSYEDKTIQCADCGADFTFGAEEQELFASKGYTNDPKRCYPCRQSRKTERYGNSGYGSSGGSGGYRPQRQMFPVVCAQCGKETEVPFEPREGRPVYCSECYSKTKLSR